jgi:hypothetical protein
MALRFSSGLLSGLQQYGQGGGAIPADPRQRNAMQAAGVTNPLLQQFGQGLGGMLGTEMRSPQQIASSEVSTALSGTPEDQMKAAQRLASLGYTEQAMKLIEAAKATQKEIKQKQLREEAVKANIARASKFNVPQETMDAYAKGGLDDTQFNKVVTDARDKIAAENINKTTETRQKAAQKAYADSRGAPASILAQIDKGEFVGNTELLQATVKGENENVKLEDWLMKDGSYKTIPTVDGKILQLGDDGKETWVWPEQAPEVLVRSPVRQATGEKAFGKITQGQATTTGAAVNVTNQMINLMDGASRPEIFKNLALSSVGFPTDKSSIVTQYNTLIPDVRGRIVSGAALKKDEEARYEKLFGISPIDAVSPTAIARKLRISYILNEVDSKLATGEMSPQGARQTLDKALEFDFSPEEKLMLDQGQFKAVLSRYQTGGGTNTAVQEAIDFFK